MDEEEARRAVQTALGRARGPPQASIDEARYALLYFGKLVEHLEQPVALWSSGGQLMLVNPALARLLDTPHDALVHMSRDEVADRVARATDDGAFVQQFRHRPAEPALHAEEVQFAGQCPRTYRWSTKPIELPDGIGALDTWLDITAERELARAALTDSLTGLANRRLAEMAAGREVARAHRSNRALSFLIVDIDHFKRVNDSLGHAAGDTVIRGVAALVERALRSSDVAARWGGEEFLAILPEADRAQARMVAERLRASVDAASLLPGLHVTVSVGSAQWNVGERAETTVGRADAALYEAKNGGRNRVR